MEVSVQAGRIVGEHWRLRSRLGDEGTSRYWEAEELRTGSHVAIEFACVDVADPQARLRFSRETRALIAFRSPHVVRTLHRGLAGDGLAFAVTEFLHGEDLGSLLAREPALGLADATQILDQVCRGICRLDVARIPYQVVEPKHVFVVRDGHDQSHPRVIKLLNVALDDQVPRKRTRSSSQYVSPEGLGPTSTVNEAAQVWALGVLGCRMLLGALPFDADSRGTLADDWGARFTRLRETKADLPVELDEWFRTAIHPDPGQRFATVEQAGLALGHIATTYASRAAARRLGTGPRLEMDRFSPKTAAVPSWTASRSEPQRVSVPPEPRLVAASRTRAAVLELDRTASLAGLQPPPEVRPSQVSLESHGSAAVERAVEHAEQVEQVEPVEQGDDIHDRETVASRVHAAASKRRKKVVASERATSLGAATGRERPDSSQVFARTPVDVSLALGFVREPAPIVVREQATLTPDRETSLEIRAAALLTAPAQIASRVVSRVVSRPPADRDAFMVGRSDSSAAERARMLRIERARWRASAVLAVILGLFGGFALRSIVSMKLRSAEHAAVDGAAFEEGIPARSVIQPPVHQPIAAGFEAASPVAEPAAPVARLISRPSRPSGPGGRVATNVRPGPGENAASASPFKRTPPPAASRKPPALDMPTETPPSAVASRAALPAAPPPVDTTPLQVYRGF